MKNNTTGSTKVDAMASIQITGNVIPQTWYRTITRPNGKPYLLAIVVLADITYWYRPTEVRDEATGQFLEYKKKFKSDMFQRSYDQFAEMFGETKRSITDAVVFLETLGVIERVFRTIEIGGVRHTNVLFIDFFPERLVELTYPPDQTNRNDEAGYPEIMGGVSRNNGGGIQPECEGYPEITGEVSRNFGTHNTKITTKITTNNKSSSTERTTGENMQPPMTDDDNSIKAQIFYDAARERYPPAIVDAVFAELKKQDRQILYSISPSVFLEICKNITEHASPKICNKSAYIRKCIDNLIAGRKLSVSRTAFRDLQLKQNYDIDELERRILSN